MFASSSLFYIMQIIHIAENSTTNNVLLAIVSFKYRIYCNVLSFTICQPCYGSHDVFYMCCTCWYDEDYGSKLASAKTTTTNILQTHLIVYCISRVICSTDCLFHWASRSVITYSFGGSKTNLQYFCRLKVFIY